jgi:hypothetical protein
VGTRFSQIPRCLAPGVALTLAAGCLGSGTQSLPATNSTTWTVHRDRRDALSIATPPGWTFTLRPVPHLVEPSVPFAVGSGSVPRGGNCAPTRAIGAVARSGVLIWVYEYHEGAKQRDFPARPRHLRLGELGGPYECLGVRAYRILFRIGHRLFQAHVVLHGTSVGLRSEAARALASMAVLPR